jgi:hypothetical protein
MENNHNDQQNVQDLLAFRAHMPCHGSAISGSADFLEAHGNRTVTDGKVT